MRSWPVRLLVALVLIVPVWVSVRAEPEAEPVFAGLTVPISGILQALRDAPCAVLKPVGTTSVVFRMELGGDIDAAFKPQTKRHPQGYLAEVAAFRIARALGMDNVAPVVPRQMTLDRLRSLLDPEFQSRWNELSAEMVVGPDQIVRGAAIYWIPDMKELGIDTPEGMGHWRRWLGQENGDPPSRDKSKLIAAQVSSMIAFDTLIGNWDRFSGSNAQGDRSGRHLFVRDHNVAFFEPLPAVQSGRLMGRLKQVGRWSRSFAEGLRRLDETTLRRALSDSADPAGFSALTESQIAGVLDRRRTILSYLAAVIDRYGEANVLTFP